MSPELKAKREMTINDAYGCDTPFDWCEPYKGECNMKHIVSWAFDRGVQAVTSSIWHPLPAAPKEEK